MKIYKLVLFLPPSFLFYNESSANWNQHLNQEVQKILFVCLNQMWFVQLFPNCARFSCWLLCLKTADLKNFMIDSNSTFQIPLILIQVVWNLKRAAKTNIVCRTFEQDQFRRGNSEKRVESQSNSNTFARLLILFELFRDYYVL